MSNYLKRTKHTWEENEYDRMNKSGFFDLPGQEICKDPEHKPPSHLHIPQGKGYRHICPSCGKETVIIPPQISF